MNNNRIWMLLAAVVSVGIIALGWFLGVSPKLDEVSMADQQRASVEDQNKIHEVRLAKMKEQFAQIDELRAELAALQRALPPGDELPAFLGQLHELEGTSGVLLTRFMASDAQKYLPAEGAATDPLVTGENFVTVTIGLTVEGSREQVIKFVNDLQYGNRLFLINQLTVTQDDNASVEDDSGAMAYTGTISG